MNLTIFADRQCLLSSTERAVEEAGFSVHKASLLDKVSDCSDVGEDIGDCDACIVVCQLVDQQAIDEDSAYRAIRKLAMDNNQKMHEFANQIITAAEVLM